MSIVTRQGFLIVFTVNFIITILFRIAYITKEKKACQWKWKTGVILGIAYIIYIMCAVFRVIDKGGIGGTDAYNYLLIYNQAENLGLIQYINGIQGASATEPLYLLINWISMHVAHNYRFALWIFHTIAFVFETEFIMGIKVKRNNLMVWIGTFLLTEPLFFMFSMLRNGLIIPILSVAVLRMCSDKMGKALGLILFALLIHTSAIIMLFLWGIIYCKKRGMLKTEQQTLLLFIIASVLVGIGIWILQPLILSKYWLYYQDKGNSPIAIRSYLIIIVTLLISRKSKKTSEDRAMQYEVTILLFFLICFIVNFKYIIIYRMVYNILPILYMHIMKLTDGVCIKKHQYTREELLMFAFGSVYFLYRCYALNVNEYQSIFPYISTIL